MRQYLITGAILSDGKIADTTVKNHRFMKVGTRAVAASDTRYETVDAAGLQALLGLADMHTHLRQPRGEDVETVASGILAAAHGGYACVRATPNTTPMQDNAGIVGQV